MPIAGPTEVEFDRNNVLSLLPLATSTAAWSLSNKRTFSVLLVSQHNRGRRRSIRQHFPVFFVRQNSSLTLPVPLH